MKTAEEILKQKLNSFGVDKLFQEVTIHYPITMKSIESAMEEYAQQFISTKGETEKPDFIWGKPVETERKELSEISDEDMAYCIRLRKGKCIVKNVRYESGFIVFGRKLSYSYTEESISLADTQTPVSIHQYLQFKGYKVPQYYPVSPQVHDSSETKGKEENNG